MPDKIVSLSLGVFVYNEEKNIETLLKSIDNQETEKVKIEEVIVISSGSYDKTNELVTKWSKRSKKVKLVTQLTRKGKASAINLFLNQAKSPVVVTVSGDLRLHKKAIEEIGGVFLDDEVGMAGAHPVPSNTKSSNIGEEIKILWELHHQIALISPKCGEMVAFRNIVRQIPHDSAVDEATLEVLLKIIGYTIVYVPRSIVYNKGPKTVREFIKQRRRVYTGHQWVAQKYNYRVVTMQSNQVSNVISSYVFSNPKSLVPMLKLMVYELIARSLGWIDYHIFSKNPYMWNMISR